MKFYDAKLILDDLNEQEFSGGIALELIRGIEETLNLRFPDDYVEYLAKLGCGFASSEDFLGMGGEPYLDMVRTYKRLREISKNAQLPLDFIPLKPDGYGNYECIDIARSSKDKSLIVFWLHDGGNDQNCEVISTGFWDWFVEEVESIREFDKQGRA